MSAGLHRLIVRISPCMFALALFAAIPASRAVAFDDPPAKPEKLTRDMTAAYKAGNYQKALEIAEKLHKLEPDNESHMYDLGCLNCLLGKKDKAYDWLEKAVDAGYKDADHMAEDSDLKTIRGEDRFRGLLARVRGDDAPKDEKKVVKKKSHGDDDEDDDDDDKPAKPARTAPKKADKPKKAAKADDDDGDDDDDKGNADNEQKGEQVQKLTAQLVQAAEAKEYDKALKLALKAQKLADIGLTNYNVACMYSLLKNSDKAFEYLERAIKKGDFPNDISEQMDGDTDLDNIKKDPRYKKMELLAKGGGEKKEEQRGGRRAGGGGAEGEKVKFEWKVTLPKGRDDVKGAPLIVVLHGHSGNMNESTKTWKKAAEKVGAVLLTPQGSYKLGDGKFQWGHDMDAIEENVTEAIDKVVAEHKVDKSKIILAGFSQGGAAAWSLALRNPDTFFGVIPVCGRCDTRSDSAFGDDDLKKLRVYALVGGEDDEAMIKSNKEAGKKLEKKGATVKINELAGVGHAYPQKADEELTKALRFILGE